MSALHKVLVVDDDPVVGRSFNRVLSNKGYVVTTAENAHEALERLRGDEFDLVFTDIRMPGMDGLELAEQVKARRPWTPVLIITGYGTEADEKRAEAAGVSRFLHKPLSPETIEGSAADALRAALAASGPRAVAVPLEAVAPEAVVPEAVALEAVLPEAVLPEAAAGPAAGASRLKDVALFLAAPFIGLAYAVLMPFVGLGMAVWFVGRALARKAMAYRVGEVVLSAAKFALAPFIGLVYVIVLPFAGLAALAWLGARAALTNRHRA
ncbi:MAG: response regulator [Burkholderiales bacterium]|nr:MAG: response regulator [Burkholderiales bacterium]